MSQAATYNRMPSAERQLLLGNRGPAVNGNVQQRKYLNYVLFIFKVDIQI
jgi:hypothetical protein